MSGDNDSGGTSQADSDAASRGNLAASLGIGGAGVTGGGGISGTSGAASAAASQGTGFGGYTNSSGGYTSGLSGNEQALADALIKTPVSIGSEFGGLTNNGITEGQQTGLQQDVQDQLQYRKYGRQVLNFIGQQVDPTTGLLTKAINSAFAPATEEELMERAIAGNIAEWEGSASLDGTGNIGMQSSIGDPLEDNRNMGQYGVYGPGKIHRDPSGENSSPLSTLVNNAVQGLTPAQATVEETEQPFNPLLEALIPYLVLNDKTIGETYMQDSPYNIGGKYDS